MATKKLKGKKIGAVTVAQILDITRTKTNLKIGDGEARIKTSPKKEEDGAETEAAEAEVTIIMTEEETTIETMTTIMEGAIIISTIEPLEIGAIGAVGAVEEEIRGEGEEEEIVEEEEAIATSRIPGVQILKAKLGHQPLLITRKEAGTGEEAPHGERAIIIIMQPLLQRSLGGILRRILQIINLSMLAGIPT